LPLDVGKTVIDFMRDLQTKLSVAQEYAKSHGDMPQARYAAHYNLRSKDKHFATGEQVLIYLQTPRRVRCTAVGKALPQW